MTVDFDESLVLIQSRFNSSRLPGKALLPIEGIPVVVLTALRAANTGKEVLVLTSSEPTDDEVCKALERREIKYFRGSLDNVLERFHCALANQPKRRIVFRLTADNVVPDGTFLDDMENEFRRLDVDILSCASKVSNLPYGISAEVFRVEKLAEAFGGAETDYDREHVTPYIYRHGTHAVFQSSKYRGLSNFRVTIDTLDDYISVKSLFTDVADVVNEPMSSLLRNFGKMKYRPYYESAVKPMTLGTAQFGLDYGITNKAGKTKKQDAIEIVKIAITEGVEYIDTAAAYGGSESVIGDALRGGWSNRVKVITKLRPFNNDEYADEKSWSLAVRNSFLQSSVNLNSRKIDTLMLHRASNLLVAPIVKELLNIRGEGLVERIGVSVQSPEELELALEHEFVAVVQMPFNILDYRWDKAIAKLQGVKKRRELIVHARSALLQGLLCSKDEKDWKRAGIDNHREIVDWLESKFKQHEKMSVSDLCIGYVNSQSWVDSVVVGVDSISNLYPNLQSVSMFTLSDSALQDIDRSRPKVSAQSLNPSTWN
ncbi:aldo/keto reductase [Bordetella genomosp. 13]|uniref:aldo/keto reductase n=1 Tax=Bordetella genomosp. 13 TaxID=463040 RepID=UPI0011A16B75|nr:aldo/keto reductase [Bordetella genomosp. 13]